MRKVAFIIPTLDNGGAERMVSNLLINLSDKYKKYLILLDGDKIIYPYKNIFALSSKLFLRRFYDEI